MAKTNVEPMTAFPDGSVLLVSTKYIGDARFRCELYVSTQGNEEMLKLRVVSACVEAPTCIEAQEKAYAYALRLYPDVGGGMKKPPYLIWPGPFIHVEGDKPQDRFR